MQKTKTLFITGNNPDTQKLYNIIKKYSDYRVIKEFQKDNVSDICLILGSIEDIKKLDNNDMPKVIIIDKTDDSGLTDIEKSSIYGFIHMGFDEQFIIHNINTAFRLIDKEKSIEIKSKEILKQIFHNMKDILLLSDPKNHKIDFISHSYDTVYGAHGKEIYNDPERLYKFIYEKDRLMTIKALNEYRRNIRNGIFDEVYRIKRPDGNIRWLHHLEFPIFNNKGEIIKNAGIIKDITKDKHSEKALLEAQDEIKNYSLSLEVKNLELEDALQSAEIASKAKTDFLSNMSHEIRTPLNGVIGYSELLKETPVNGIQKEYIENITVAAHSLLGIINDILDFSKIEAGKVELETIKTDIIKTAEEAISIISFQSAKKNLELLINISPEMPKMAIVDPVRLKQILVNLLSNAVKFTEKGEIELRIRFLRLSDKTGIYEFAVRDTGIGITKEQKDRLFKAFSQADTSTTRKFGGTGLGLIISNLLSHKMGSNIEFISEPDKGSTFFFSIETEYEKPDRDRDIGDLEVNNVLLIDDNKKNQQILKNIFNYWKIDFTGCDNGISALRELESSKKYDMIMVDYDMPYLDGLETIKMIREKLSLSPEEQPVILLHNAHESGEIKTKSKELGIRFNITKPVRISELILCMKNLHNPSSQVLSSLESLEELETVITPLKGKKGISVLIAEDVDMGRKLAKTVIEKILPEAEIAEAVNGKEAFEKTIELSPDIIFMDVQMPEMDGIESTKVIREFESKNQSAKKSVIIALTAGAFKEEREKCHNAGMDNFLTKPIDSKELMNMIKVYLSLEHSDDNEKSNIDLETDGLMIYDKENLKKRLGFSDDIIQSFIMESEAVIAELLEDLTEFIENEDSGGIHKSSHKLKGCLYNLCFDRMGKVAELIEINYNGDKQYLSRLLNELEKEWDILRTKLFSKKS